MKKLIFATALFFCTAPAFAQKGFFLQPVVGVGLTNANTDFHETDLNGNNTGKSAAPGYRCQIGIGYSFGRWSIGSGIGYFRTGYDKKVIVTTAANPTGQGGDTRIRAIYSHVGIPVQVGYRLGLTKRLAFEPALGAEVTYNLGRTTDLSGALQERHTDEQGYFTKNHQRISLFGAGQLHLSYRLQPGVALTGGLSGRYMLTNFLKRPYDPQYDAKQHNYLLTVDLGIKCRI